MQVPNKFARDEVVQSARELKNRKKERDRKQGFLAKKKVHL